MGAPRLVPIEELPPELRTQIKVGSPTFIRYARALEDQHKLLPGTLTDNVTIQAEDPLGVLSAAALDQRKQMAEASAAARAEKDKKALDPSAGGGELYGIKTPQWLDRGLSAAGKSVYDTARGIGQWAGLVHQKDIDEAAARDQPLMDTTAGKVGYGAGVLGQLALPAGAMRAARLPGVLANRYAQAGALGTAYGAAQPVETGSDRTGQATVGALTSLLGEGAGHAVQAAVRPATATLAANVRPMAERALKKYGIPFRASDLRPNAASSLAHGATDLLPGSGADEAFIASRKGYNAALARTMGQEEDDLSLALRNAKPRLGDTYTDLSRRNTAEFDPAVHNKPIADAWQTFRDNDLTVDPHVVPLSPQDNSLSARVQKQLSDQLLGKSTLNPVTGKYEMPGEQYQTLRTAMRKNAQSSVAQDNPTLKDLYQTVKAQLDHAMRNSSSMSAEDRAAWALADRQWGNMRTLENIAPADAGGDANFSALARTMSGKNANNVYNRDAMIYGDPASHDLVDLAKIGVTFGGKGPKPTDWNSVGGVARGLGKTAVAPAAVAGGLYASNLHDEDPWTETAKELAALGLLGPALGRGLNSRWFAQGAKFGVQPAVDLAIRAGAPRGLLGYTLAGERGAPPEGSLSRDVTADE